MSIKTIDHFFSWLKQYLAENELSSFHISLHGGEPLLAGPDLIEHIALHRAALESHLDVQIRLALMTNALLLNDQWMELFKRNRIRFGVSIDGPRVYHDRYRVTHKGEGTHHQVAEKIRWIIHHPYTSDVFSSALCVLHPKMDGEVLFQYFYNLGLNGVDFLLPDQNYAHRSAHYPPPTSVPTYGIVLEQAYRAWRRTDDPNFHIRLFELAIEAHIGIVPGIDFMGTGPISVFTVETNGEVEPVDTMKICGNGFTKTGVKVQQATSMDINKIPLIEKGLNKANHTAHRCRKCRNYQICGGGYLPHRYSTENEFENPTVYCADMMHLCDLIKDDVDPLLSGLMENRQTYHSDPATIKDSPQ